jgi:glucuronate isomerase
MASNTKICLAPNRYFDPDPRQQEIAIELYNQVAGAPLICPHGHVDPRTFADPDYNLGTPTELLLMPDHYILRMLYSQGIKLEHLGIPARDGTEVEQDHRRIWRIFAENFYLFRATPSGMWLNHELQDVFGVEDKLTSETADQIYDHILGLLATPEFRPRKMFERFNIEVLATTDAATDTLDHHRAIRQSGWRGRVVPTFRPDGVINPIRPDWRKNIARLAEVSGIEVNSFSHLVEALEQRRALFKAMGATATDQAALTPYTGELSPADAEAIFQRALKGQATQQDATLFLGHMLMESARMSIEDGLVMQLHPGSYRDHNRAVLERFGTDKGADIPIPVEFTRNLGHLLNKYGNDTRLTLILFTLDESTYSRELAPLAGHYPAVKLGPPWWFYDSLNGMRRYRDLVIETAGLYNTAGFNDDTRAFPSIPARHDLARRVDANWLAGLVVRGIIDKADAEDMIHETAYRLARRAYKL